MDATKPKVALLEGYIRAVRFRDGYALDRRIFDIGLSHTSPVLESDRCNRILLCPGAFNPPSPIVLRLNDERLASKFEGHTDTTLFTQAGRANLWKVCLPSDWYWIYDRDEEGWNYFRRKIVKKAANDGFEIKFVFLCRCEELIVSDVTRPSEFFSAGFAKPLVIRGCRSWHHLGSDFDDFERQAKEDAFGLFGRLSLIDSCMMKDFAEDVSFIPGQRSKTPISSTIIRQYLRAHSGAELREKLKGVALNPDLLVEYIGCWRQLRRFKK
ncbi:MAG: hypothetical protein Q9173_003700 [Seirophora scorigena]